MSISLANRKIFLFIVLVLAGFAAFGLNHYFHRSSLDKTNAEIWASYEITDQARSLPTLISDMITLCNDYIDLQQPLFLQDYNRVKSEASNLIADLRDNTRDKFSQSSRVQELQQHFMNLSQATDKASSIGKRNAETTRIIEMSKENVLRISEAILQREKELVKQYRQAAQDQIEEYTDAMYRYGGLLTVFILGYIPFLFRSSTTTPAHRKDNSLISTLQEGIFDWDMQTGNVLYTKKFWDILGYDPDELPPAIDSFKSLLHPDEQERVNTDCLKGRTVSHSSIFRMRHKKNHWIWVGLMGSTGYDGIGTPIRITGALRDITQFKHREEELENEAEKARHFQTAQNDFLAHISHEISTPLTAICGIAEILSKKTCAMDEGQQKLVQTLRSSTEMMSELIHQTLDFAKLECGQIALEETLFNLPEFFEQTASILSVRAQKKGLNFKLDIEEIVRLKMLGDRHRLRQILVNLISNAVKFTEKGYVRVKARKLDVNGACLLRVDIEDTGPGIAPKNLAAIFERFKQEDETIHEKYGGTGLGLTLSLRLAHMMGGGITVDSIPGRSIFTLTVPLNTEETLADNELDLFSAKEKKSSAASCLPANDGKRILLVENHQDTSLVFSHFLTTMGLEHDIAKNTEETLHFWRVRPYELILMSIQMSDMNGLATAAEIRRIEQEENLERTPIVGMITSIMRNSIDPIVMSGIIDSYLVKPATEASFHNIIAEFIEKRKDSS